MKKVWLLLVMLLAGCGSGGDDAATGAGPVGTGTGSLSLEFVDKVAKTAGLVVPAPGWVRVVVSNPNLNGTTYKQVKDLPFGGAAVAVMLPVGTGYTVEAIYYSKSDGQNRMSNYGAATGVFSIIEDQNSSVAVEMSPITVGLSVSDDPVYSTFPDNTYSVSATIGDVGLQQAWSLAARTTPFTSAVHLSRIPTANYTAVTAPEVYVQSNLYFQGEFFIKPSLISQGESVTSWTFHYDAPFNKQLLVHTGSTSITPPSDTIVPRVTAFAVPLTVLGGKNVTPISIGATDNVAIIGYQITETPTPPAWAPPGTGGWLPAMPTAYPVSANVAHGVDNAVTLYCWVEDYVQVSAAAAGVTDKTVVINDSPSVDAFALPRLDSNTVIPVSAVIGKNNTGTAGELTYLITESATVPAVTDTGWKSTVPTSYTVKNLTQQPGGRYTVQLFAWVKDAHGSISRPLSNYVTITDAPQVTEFKVPSQIENGTVVPVTSFIGAAAPGHSIVGYLITRTNTVPADATFGAKPATFNYAGALAGGNRYLYGWVKDERGIVSYAGVASTRFLNP